MFNTPLQGSSLAINQPAVKKQKIDQSNLKVSDGSLHKLALGTGRDIQQKQLDYDITKLVCVRGMVPAILDSKQWKTFMNDANPHYKSPSSTTVRENFIPAEAARIRQAQIEYLKTQRNLTMTFDGGTTRRPQSVYTVTVTTAKRETFLIDGHESSREHHTAKYLAEMIQKVCCII